MALPLLQYKHAQWKALWGGERSKLPFIVEVLGEKRLWCFYAILMADYRRAFEEQHYTILYRDPIMPNGLCMALRPCQSLWCSFSHTTNAAAKSSHWTSNMHFSEHYSMLRPYKPGVKWGHKCNSRKQCSSGNCNGTAMYFWTSERSQEGMQ